MINFLSLDWGTTAFRLRLIEVPSLKVAAQLSSAGGINQTYANWQAASPEQSPNRLRFYQEVIKARLQQLEKQNSIALAGIPLLVSGMASSTIGMRELPYQPVPFALDGTGLKTELIPASADFPNDLYLISGVCTTNDVMRGEETQLIGFAQQTPDTNTEQVYIFPGTHSKHIWVRQKLALGFNTYMTGEFFALLTKQSILRTSVSENAELSETVVAESFKAGLEAAHAGNLLQLAFRVRTNDLFRKFTPNENLHYLSGLLIGLELQDLRKTSAEIYLCGGENLHKPYAQALRLLELPQKVHLYAPQLADEAVIRGQYQILTQLKYLT